MPNELKPCPFCGAQAIVLNEAELNRFVTKQLYFVTCTVCGVETPRMYITADRAKEVWNRRVDNG